MKLKRLNHYRDFLAAVQTCDGEVYFNSSEGDHLNLRSAFCQMLFASIVNDRQFLEQGSIECTEEVDYTKLQPFLIPERGINAGRSGYGG